MKHLATVITAHWASMDWSSCKEWYESKRADLQSFFFLLLFFLCAGREWIAKPSPKILTARKKPLPRLTDPILSWTAFSQCKYTLHVFTLPAPLLLTISKLMKTTKPKGMQLLFKMNATMMHSHTVAVVWYCLSSCLVLSKQLSGTV